jgi:DNA-binding MarR family transcriptional regulator
MHPFDLDTQQQHTESKIVVALERIAEAFRVLLWEQSKETKLSPIQIQLLIFLQFHAEDQCKVGYLAQEFNMTKATISDSVRLLKEKGLIKTETDPSDTRSYVIHLTEQGKAIVQKTTSFANAIEKPLHSFPAQQKEVLLASLLNIIYQLQKAGIITIQRMCLSCRFYQSHEDHS